jgi:prepilin-type N-terminal cleavage/methylation domain-containing protein
MSINRIQRARRARRGDAGFTLTEIMVAVVLMGILLIAAIPNLAEYNADRKLRAATSDLEVCLRRARSSAVTRNIDVRVSLDPTAGTLVRQMDTDGDGTFETQVSTRQFPKGVRIAYASFGGGTSVTFNGRGIPDNPGSVLLYGANDKVRLLILAAGSGAITITHSIDII